jgi:hypothetical protein
MLTMLAVNHTSIVMYLSRSLMLLAAVFAFAPAISALPTPGAEISRVEPRGTTGDLCVLKRGDDAEAEVAC